ncbi:MAG TPA: SDR family NAD(P)-dependent oxidoreductase [Polyangiaceae bacterium]|nr:SDR family NAD(P)-dependent oxidoreductase [Polyangiaceae bacterium]
MTESDQRLLRLLRDARQQLELERRHRSEPIAIVGVGCRFPGDVSGPSEFWDLLRRGADVTSEVPTDRWDAEALYDPEPTAPGKCYTKRGGFLDEIDGFEPGFFGISPREAVSLDPQQRLLLEVTWEALENAGIVPETLRGSATGVWIGLSLDDYARLSVPAGQLDGIDAYSALGTARSVAAGRIAYVLGVHGPVMQLDTACSSSLVAVHLACQSLRAGESDLALVGGVNIMASPEASVALCKLQALSRDGRCKTFDAAADGYGRGEGCGIVVLKTLSAAQAAGDRILATIRGSAVNHDGASNGLTAPSGVAQEAVLRRALANASVESDSVDYVEAHGTGTLLGDPIEVLALNRVYAAKGGRERPLYLGSVKTNFGHLEAAAGIAALIKTALCLAHGQLVPHLHFENPNPKIPWNQLSVRVTSKGMAWPSSAEPARAGVSSFGISGTNAHAVLEAAPRSEPLPQSSTRSAELIVLSARTDSALRVTAQRLGKHLEQHPEIGLRDLAFSLATTRSLREHRLCLVASSRQALCAALDSVDPGQTPVPTAVTEARTSRGKLAWLFTGQGAQRLGMGQALYREWPAFQAALDAAFAALDPHLDRPLREVMWATPQTREAEPLHQTEYTQPALFAFEWALAALFDSWGVHPDFVAGHSIGELTAACVARVFSLNDAARLVCARARLMQALPPGGVMFAIAASQAELADHLSAQVTVAAVNAPSSVVISGEEAAVASVVAKLSARGVASKRLTVSHAFHSALMEPMLESCRRVAKTISYHPPSVPVISNVSGAFAGSEISGADYWVRHVRQAVQFSAGVQALHAAGAATFLELGPKTTLLPLVAATLTAHATHLLGCVGAAGNEAEGVLQALGGWIALGGGVSLQAVFPAGNRLELPTRAWQRERYWIESRSEPRVAREIEASALDNAVYRLEWRPAPALQSPRSMSGRWAVVSLGSDGRAEELLAALAALGATPERVAIEQLAQLSPFADHVVCAWGGSGDAEAAMQAAHQGLAIANALARRANPPRLWWLTRAAVAARPGDEVAVAGASLWGLGRTVMQEYPELRCTLLDLDRESASAGVLAHEAAASDHETQVAWRGTERHLARLLRAPQGERVSLGERLASPGTYLVTGGLSGLGAEVARHFAQRGARHLLLIGRRGLATAGAPALVAELEALGTEVTVAALDVADRAALSSVLQAIPAQQPLRGIVHAAGLVRDGGLASQTREQFEQVLAPKVLGAWNLHALTQHLSLDLFVLFSSIAGTLGFAGAGKGAYAGASSFLDGLAAHRRARGQAGLSLGWGPWTESGMATALTSEQRAGLARYLSHFGLSPLSRTAGLELFDRSLSGSDAALLVSHLDVHTLGRTFGAAVPPLWQELVRPAASQARSETSWARELLALPSGQRSDAVTALVRAEVARVLSYGSARDVPVDKPLGELGLDSLLAMELTHALERRTGSTIPATLILKHPSVQAMSAHVLSLIVDKLEQPPERRAIRAYGEQLNRVAAPQARLFCFHDAGGSATLFAPLSELGESGVEVHAVSHVRGETQNGDDAERYLRDAVAYIDGFADKPFALLGHSLGSSFAWRVLEELERLGQGLPALFLPSAAPPPRLLDSSSSPAQIGEAFWLAVGSPQPTELVRAAFIADVALCRSLLAAPSTERLAVPIAALLGSGDPVSSAADMQLWSQLTTQAFSLTVLPGDHFYLRDAQARRGFIAEIARRMAALAH